MEYNQNPLNTTHYEQFLALETAVGEPQKLVVANNANDEYEVVEVVEEDAWSSDEE